MPIHDTRARQTGMGYGMFLCMRGRPAIFSFFCQLFLLFTFLSAPIADGMHAIRMLQTTQGDMQKPASRPSSIMLANGSTPCHEAMLVAAESSIPDRTPAEHSSDKKPCCPYKQCSPKNCLMHLAIASMPVLEIIAHSPIDSRIFLDAGIQLVSVPFTERLRPPIA